jgi:predicted DCC family thiol-disulfide oxidoreductase YuxK
MVTPLMADAWLEGEWRGQVPLTVLYDPRCPLCRKLRGWLAGQRTVVPIEFVAAASPEAAARFPDLDHARTVTVLTVVAADGAVFEAERAWLMCAWALPSWQPVAERLGTRAGLPLVGVVARAVDWYRHRLIARSYREGCVRCRLTAPTPSLFPDRRD